MEQTDSQHTPDQQAGSATRELRRPEPSDDPAVTEDTDNAAEPTEPDTGFEPV